MSSYVTSESRWYIHQLKLTLLNSHCLFLLTNTSFIFPEERFSKEHALSWNWIHSNHTQSLLSLSGPADEFLTCRVQCSETWNTVINNLPSLLCYPTVLNGHYK
jgi:hypothetical protein